MYRVILRIDSVFSSYFHRGCMLLFMDRNKIETRIWKNWLFMYLDEGMNHSRKIDLCKLKVDCKGRLLSHSAYAWEFYIYSRSYMLKRVALSQ